MSVTRLAWGAVLLVVLASPPARAEARCALAGEALNLYEWMAPAPVVLAGRALERDGRWHDVEVLAVLRGGPAPGAQVRVDVRRANRERDPRLRPLRLEPGSRYVFLLEPLPAAAKDPRPRFRLVRGVRGVRPLPAEQQPLFLEALGLFAQVQATGSEDAVWRATAQWLEARNPLLVQVALQQYLRYGRADRSLLGHLLPLLDHPRAPVRCLAVELLGRVVAGAPALDAEAAQVLFTALVAKARTDPSVAVRVAATRALGGLAGPGVDEVLDQIARDDPEQDVRLAAARTRLVRRAEGEDPGPP